jgi:hypothetical protein
MASSLVRRRFLRSIKPLDTYLKWNGACCIDMNEESRLKRWFSSLWNCFCMILNTTSGFYIIAIFVASTSIQHFKQGSTFSPMNSLNGVIAHCNPVLFGVIVQFTLICTIRQFFALILLRLEKIDQQLIRPKLTNVRKIAIGSVIFAVLSVL